MTMVKLWEDVKLRRFGSRKAARRQTRLAVEGLEQRLVLYSASGNAWPSPQLITISFMPDGTNLGGATSNLQSTFNAKFGAVSWQNIILKAAQTWATYANINFALVSDNGADAAAGQYQQGDPNMGDIRIGGYNFGAGSSTLANAYMPPPANNFSLAGDITFNTGQPFNNGTTYDLYTVAAHEIGHALGLYHSSTSPAEQFSTYNGTKSAFNADDIAGIKAIYGARTSDAYDANGDNGTQATADDITSKINSSTLVGTVTGLDITTTSDIDNYKFTVPAGSSSTISVRVSSAGISLLSPYVQVLNSAGIVVAQDTTTSYGGTKTLSINGVSPGQVYTIRVKGTESTPFGTGAYAIGLNLGTNAMPSIITPVTQLLNGTILQVGGGQALVVGNATLANTYTAGIQSATSQHSVALNGLGESVVVWTSQNGQDGSGSGVFGQRYDSTGAKVGGEFKVNTYSAGDQLNPTVAIDSLGNFIVVWQSNGQDGDGGGIYAQGYDLTGAKVGGEFRVNTTTYNDQTNPTVVVDLLGNFTIAWQSNLQDGSGWGIYAKRYSNLGFPVSGEFRVNTSTLLDQTNPAMGVDMFGNLVVAWQGQDSSSTGIFAQRYNLLGLPVGGEFLVNTTTNAEQSLPTVAMSSNGNWAVTWQSNGQDGDGWGIYGQRFNVLGGKVGSEFRVNTTTIGNQQNPSAAMNDSGDLFVTWAGIYGSTYTIFGQQYTATGAALGGEFIVNQITGTAGNNPSVALNNAGTAISVWSGGNSTDSAGVLVQWYSLKFLQDTGYTGAKGRQLVVHELMQEYASAAKTHDHAKMTTVHNELVTLRHTPITPTKPAARPHIVRAHARRP